MVTCFNRTQFALSGEEERSLLLLVKFNLIGHTGHEGPLRRRESEGRGDKMWPHKSRATSLPVREKGCWTSGVMEMRRTNLDSGKWMHKVEDRQLPCKSLSLSLSLSLCVYLWG